MTARQLQILTAIANGRSHKEAAGDVGISIHGISEHLTRLRKTFQARTTVHLVKKAIDAGHRLGVA